MAITLNDDHISGVSSLGIGKTPGTTLDISGTLTATAFSGSGSGLTGYTKGFEYYTHNNSDLSIGGSAQIARTITSGAPAGEYMVMFGLNWREDVAPGGDEDSARFYITSSNGTVNTTFATSHEENINSGIGQRGFQGMFGMAHVTLTSSGSIYLYFNNIDGDTDTGGFGGSCSVMVWKRAT
jgi:hypothetical protein